MSPYPIALTLIPGLGPKSIRQLLDINPDVEALFAMTRPQLKDIFGKHQMVIDAIAGKTTLAQAEAIIAEAKKYNIEMLFFKPSWVVLSLIILWYILMSLLQKKHAE